MGASWVRTHILDDHPKAKMSVLVVWEPLYAGDSRRKIPDRMFDDRRVTSFWDPNAVSGKWLGGHRIGTLEGGIIWDAYYAFPKTSRWTDIPTDVVATGSDIIGHTSGLQRSFEPLLR